MNFSDAVRKPVKRTVRHLTMQQMKGSLIGLYENEGDDGPGGIAQVMCEGLELYLFPTLSDDYVIVRFQAGPHRRHYTVVEFHHEWPTLAYKAALEEMMREGVRSAFGIHDDYKIEEDDERDSALDTIMSAAIKVEDNNG